MGDEGEVVKNGAMLRAQVRGVVDQASFVRHVDIDSELWESSWLAVLLAARELLPPSRS